MTLTILDQQSQEPVLVLHEDERGVKLVQGDLKMVKALGLEKFANLKEIADYLNSAGSPYRAQFEEDGSQEEQDAGAPGEEGNADLDTRIKPALDVLKDLLSRVGDREKRDEAAEASQRNEAEMLNTTDSQVVGQDMSPIFVSLDGDNIGNAVARSEDKDDEKALSEMSNRINAGQDVLRNWAMRMGGKVIEQGGDEGLVKVPASAKPHIEELRAQYASVVGATATVGVGKKISESTQARMLGKLKGKNQTVYFDESTARELKLRLQDQEQTEPNKIRAAMAEPTQGGGANEEAKRGRGSDPGAPGDSSGPETASGDPVQASGDGGGATGSEQAPGQAPGQEEGAKPPFSPQLMEEVGKKTPPKEPKAPNLTASLYHDPEIENADYSDSEDPEFSKALAYVAKYGAYGNG